MVIRNAGRGYLSGDLHLQDYDRGFTIDNSVVEGNETVIRLTASSLDMPENSRQQSTLTLSSNGGNHTVELAYQGAPATATAQTAGSAADRADVYPARQSALPC
jgi:hypothetical protein